MVLQKNLEFTIGHDRVPWPSLPMTLKIKLALGENGPCLKPRLHFAGYLKIWDPCWGPWQRRVSGNRAATTSYSILDQRVSHSGRTMNHFGESNPTPSESAECKNPGSTILMFTVVFPGRTSSARRKTCFRQFSLPQNVKHPFKLQISFQQPPFSALPERPGAFMSAVHTTTLGLAVLCLRKGCPDPQRRVKRTSKTNLWLDKGPSHQNPRQKATRWQRTWMKRGDLEHICCT